MQQGSRRAWIGYAALLVLSGLVNELSLLVWLAHAVLVADRGSRAARPAWAKVSAAAFACIAPFVIATARQRQQVAWLTSPDVDQLRRFLNLQWESTWLPVTILLGSVALYCLQRWRPTPALPRMVTPSPAWKSSVLLGLSWALIPALLLWILAQRHPLFVPRYLVFVIPGGALALGAALSLLRLPLALIPAIALAVSGLHAQQVYRRYHSGHLEDLRTVAAFVRDNSAQGDGILFLPGSRRIVALAYPEDFSRTDDVAAVPSSGADILYGRETGRIDAFDAAALDHARLWVVTGQTRLGDEVSPLDEDKLRLLSQHYTVSLVRSSGRFTTLLYVRERQPSSPVPAPARRTAL